MSINTVLFDLDGTLLPMDQDAFTKIYFSELAKKFADYGYNPEAFTAAVQQGVKAMVKNDGNLTNEKVFWDIFIAIQGEKVLEYKEAFNDFYRNEFNRTKAACSCNPESAVLIKKLKSKGLRLVLATNPLFPNIATENRIGWAGLKPSDFEIYTTYENSCHCKPNPEYYRDIIDRLELKPEECLMVGNDVIEDMVAEKLGMQVFLLTDCIINKENRDISAYRQGGFKELYEFIEK